MYHRKHSQGKLYSDNTDVITLASFTMDITRIASFTVIKIERSEEQNKLLCKKKKQNENCLIYSWSLTWLQKNVLYKEKTYYSNNISLDCIGDSMKNLSFKLPNNQYFAS